jgi:hypothetical protein
MKIETITPGVLTVATYLGFAPFAFLFLDKNGSIIGTDIQYLEKICKTI